MLKLENGTKRLGGTMQATGLQTGRLGNQFAGLAGHIAQVHPIVGNLAGVLGNFAVGAGLTVGVLGGVAAIALAYDALTKSAREATKAQDDAVKALSKMLHVKAGGPAGETASQIAQAHGQLARLQKREAELQNEVRANQGIPGFTGAAILAGSQGRLKDVQDEIENLKNIIKASQAVMKSDIDKKNVETLGEAQRKQAAAHAKIEAALRKQESDLIAYNNLMASIYGDRSILEPETTKALRERLQLERSQTSTTQFGKDLAADVKEQATSGQFGGDFSMPNVGLNDSVTKEQRKGLEKMGIFVGDNADKNAEEVRDAIWGSAMQLGNTLVSALNIGGGGKGSNLGGALGATAGFGIGMFATGGSPIGGAIGSTIGNIIGSVVGGLFDKELTQEEIWAKQLREQKAHTAWLAANNRALNVIAGALLNSPSGYKTASGRFDATEVKEFRRGLQRYATRGGAPILVSP